MDAYIIVTFDTLKAITPRVTICTEAHEIAAQEAISMDVREKLDEMNIIHCLSWWKGPVNGRRG